MKVPEWADAQLSKDLPNLRAKGESQDLEYIETFPQNVRELAKEIAAFASSNQGIILIGVSDSGDLIGLSDASTSEGRDELLRRIEGICRGTIKPALTPSVKFAIESEKNILVLIVPRGNQPIYYCNNIPYLRHITESRPAEPHEVIESIRSWSMTESYDIDKPTPLGIFLSNLARILVDVLIYGDEVDDRSMNPWLDMWRAQFHQAAFDLRELGSQDIASKNNLSRDLFELADALDNVSSFHLYMGCWPEFSALINRAIELAKIIKIRNIDPIPISEASLNEVRQTIPSESRKLRNLVDRAEDMVRKGRLEEFQTLTSNIGLTLLRTSYYNIESLQVGINDKLRTIGKNLHLIETIRIYLDGGQSIRAIIERVTKLASELEEITTLLE